MSGSFLVTAGTGKTGSRIVSRLRARGLSVRVGSRDASPPFDWRKRQTWDAALRDVEAAYVAYFPDAAFPGAADDVASFVRLASQRGVSRVVLLADRGAVEAERCEEAVRSSAAQWTVLRTGFINQNFSEGFLAEAVRDGVVALPVTADVAEPFTDADDIAAVATRALADAGHGGQVYDLTGPRLMTFADAVAEIAVVAKRSVRYVPVPADRFVARLRDSGTPADLAHDLAALMDEVFDGRRARLTNDVERVLGRPSRDFSDYVKDAIRAGDWADDQGVGRPQTGA